MPMTASQKKASAKQPLMTDTSHLTPRQREIYEFIRESMALRGYPPTVREIGDEFGIKSPNGVMCHLKALSKKGMIQREPNISRGISLGENFPIVPIRVSEKGIGDGVANAHLLGKLVDFGRLIQGGEGHQVLNGALDELKVPSGVTLITKADAPVGIWYYNPKSQELSKARQRGFLPVVNIALASTPMKTL